MKKHTAVEHLEIKLLGIVSFDSEVLRNKYKEQFKIAKEIEKEQIIYAHISGMEFIAVEPNHYYNDAEQYYNETFKKRKMTQTPKEKAEELVDKMYGKTPVRDLIAQIEEDKQYAKQCALIAVDEILNINSVDKDFSLSHYWLDVKDEIQNL